MATTKEILIAARKTIENPGNWCRGAVALDAENQPVGSWDSSACKWCAYGAISKFAGFGSELMRVLDTLEDHLCGVKIGDYNDTHNHAEVLAMFDKAIAKCENI